MTPPSETKLSIIVPALNEEALLPRTLQSLDTSCDEVIVVDGGSTDGTRRIARDFGAKVISSRRGRAWQMNAGAKAAQGEMFLFLHADTTLPENYSASIDNALKKGAAGGAFGFSIRAPGFRYRIIEAGVSARSRILGLPYGDQALFVSRDVFQKMGGFQEMEIMEDFEFSRRIRKHGRFELLGSRVQTSSRRWHRAGAARVTLLNQAILIGYFLGISTENLAEWYKALMANPESLRKHANYPDEVATVARTGHP